MKRAILSEMECQRWYNHYQRKLIEAEDEYHQEATEENYGLMKYYLGKRNVFEVLLATLEED